MDPEDPTPMTCHWCGREHVPSDASWWNLHEHHPYGQGLICNTCHDRYNQMTGAEIVVEAAQIKTARLVAIKLTEKP